MLAALHYAAMEGSEDLCKCLLQARASATVQDAHGMAPLAHAVSLSFVCSLRPSCSRVSTKTANFERHQEYLDSTDETDRQVYFVNNRHPFVAMLGFSLSRLLSLRFASSSAKFYH